MTIPSYIKPSLSNEVGIGYNSDLGKTTNNYCLDHSEVSRYGSLQSSANLSLNNIGESRTEDLSLSGKFEAERLGLKVSAEGKFTAKVEEADYALTLSFKNEVELPSQILHIRKYGLDALNDFGKSVLSRNPERFKELCGDKFVVQEKSGAQLVVVIKIAFGSKASKKEFEISGKVEFMKNPAISLTAEAELGISGSSDNDQSMVRVYAYQRGGEIVKLPKILGSNNYAILSCRLADEEGIKKCNELTNNILNYAKKDFANQINYENSKEASPIGYVYNSYKNIGLTTIEPGLTKEIEEIQEYFGKAVNKLEKAAEYLLHLIYSGKVGGPISQGLSGMYWHKAYWDWNPSLLSIMGKTQLDYANQVIKQLSEFLTSTNRGVILCLTKPGRCNDVKADLISLINDVDAGNELELAEAMIGEKLIGGSYEYIEPFSKFKQVYKMSVNCNKSGLREVKDMYSGRVIFPIGEDRYIEDTTYIHKEEDLTEKKVFHNEYEILFNEDKSVITNFKIKPIAGVILDYDDCGEYPKKEIGTIPFFEMAVSKNECIKAICGDSEIEAALVELYQVTTPI